MILCDVTMPDIDGPAFPERLLGKPLTIPELRLRSAELVGGRPLGLAAA